MNEEKKQPVKLTKNSKEILIAAAWGWLAIIVVVSLIGFIAYKLIIYIYKTFF